METAGNRTSAWRVALGVLLFAVGSIIAAACLLVGIANAPTEPAEAWPTDEAPLHRTPLAFLPEARWYLNIPALESTLEQLATERPGVNPCATIRIDAGLTWHVMRRVVFTCASAGQTVGLALPDGTEAGGPPAQPLERSLLVFMAADGFRVWDVRWSKRFPPENARPLAELLKWLEPNTALRLKPDDDTPAAEVVRAYETVRLAGHRVSLE